jgi:RNA recognition motif-containing protein
MKTRTEDKAYSLLLTSSSVARRRMNHKRLYIGDLAPTITESELQQLFASAGDVESIKLVRSRSGTSQSFAFVEMASPEAAREAIRRYNGYELSGYRLIVYTVPPQSRPRDNSH